MAFKPHIQTECSSNIETKTIKLSNQNWYENINWISYTCSDGVYISEHDGALYLSTWKENSNVTYGECEVKYIKTDKIITIQ